MKYCLILFIQLASLLQVGYFGQKEALIEGYSFLKAKKNAGFKKKAILIQENRFDSLIYFDKGENERKSLESYKIKHIIKAEKINVFQNDHYQFKKGLIFSLGILRNPDAVISYRLKNRFDLGLGIGSYSMPNSFMFRSLFLFTSSHLMFVGKYKFNNNRNNKYLKLNVSLYENPFGETLWSSYSKSSFIDLKTGITFSSKSKVKQFAEIGLSYYRIKFDFDNTKFNSVNFVIRYGLEFGL